LIIPEVLEVYSEAAKPHFGPVEAQSFLKAKTVVYVTSITFPVSI
jgi:hypothetical protein